jgi:DNA-binding transcriptional MerR regulator
MPRSRPHPSPEAPLWTLAELHAQAEAVLAAGAISSGSGRVRAIPDERTLRYYTTVGLLAGPALMKGRKAYYSALHLAQIVAIKRLQATGLSLAQVQRELAGATAGELQALAVLPKTLPRPVATAPSRRAFWQELPEAPQPGPAPSAGAWLELAPGAVLLVQGVLPAGEALAALRASARPLLVELQAQGLLPIPWRGDQV